MLIFNLVSKVELKNCWSNGKRALFMMKISCIALLVQIDNECLLYGLGWILFLLVKIALYGVRFRLSLD